MASPVKVDGLLLGSGVRLERNVRALLRASLRSEPGNQQIDGASWLGWVWHSLDGDPLADELLGLIERVANPQELARFRAAVDRARGASFSGAALIEAALGRPDPATQDHLDALIAEAEGQDGAAADLGVELCQLAEQHPDPEALAASVLGLLVEGEPWQRAAVLGFLVLTPDLPGTDVLCGLFGPLSEALIGEPNPFDSEDGGDLSDLLLAVLAERFGTPGGERARWLLRHEALRPGRAGLVIGHLRDSDADWIAERAADLVRSEPLLEAELGPAAPASALDAVRAGAEPVTRARLLRTAALRLDTARPEQASLASHLLEEARALDGAQA